MAAGFISKTLSTLLSSVARWVEFGDGSSAPVHGAVMLDPDTGLVNAFTKSFSPRRYSAGYADLSPAHDHLLRIFYERNYESGGSQNLTKLDR